MKRGEGVSRRFAGHAAVALASLVLVMPAAAQQAVDTFKATASVTRGEAQATTPITITVTGYTPAAERTAVLTALRDGGTAGVRKALSALPDVGVIEMGGRRTPIKFAAARPTASGRLVTIVTAEPMLFLGAGIPHAPPRAGDHLAVALLDVRDDGAGIGELAPAATVATDAEGALRIEDYGATVVWLQNLFRAR